MSYTLSFSQQAETYLRRLDRRAQERMSVALRALMLEPRGPATKRLKSAAGRWSLRVGGWRVIYLIDEDARVLRIDVIAPRGQVYRRL